jgi:glycosyltransferase involved in cell wall biosynthesis
MLRILNVNDMLDAETGGGTAERTFQMSCFLARQKDVSCTVLTIMSKKLDASRIAALQPAEALVLSCLWQRFHVPHGGWKKIRQVVAQADLIHLMGHWSVLNALVYLAARWLGKPYVICPAGALPLFGRSGWLKRLYNLLIGYAIVRNASGWIAVTASELPQFEAYGVSASRVTVIPNGVNAEDFPAVDVMAFRSRHNLPVDAPLILFMGRLNPIKGPDLLLQAFLAIRRDFPAYHLAFAGPDGGMLADLRAETVRAGVQNAVHFLGYVSGADKVAAYRTASLLVVPSRQEAMSIVAIEAGICGVPVLLTDQCGFGQIRSLDARLEVPATVSGLATGLTALLSNPVELAALSHAWTEFANRAYVWDALVPEYLRLYRNILMQAQR